MVAAGRERQLPPRQVERVRRTYGFGCGFRCRCRSWRAPRRRRRRVGRRARQGKRRTRGRDSWRQRRCHGSLRSGRNGCDRRGSRRTGRRRARGDCRRRVTPRHVRGGHRTRRSRGSRCAPRRRHGSASRRGRARGRGRSSGPLPFGVRHVGIRHGVERGLTNVRTDGRCRGSGLTRVGHARHLDTPDGQKGHQQADHERRTPRPYEAHMHACDRRRIGTRPAGVSDKLWMTSVHPQAGLEQRPESVSGGRCARPQSRAPAARARSCCAT